MDTPTSDACPCESELSQFQVGDLRGAHFDKIADHVRTCERCADSLDRLSGATNSLVVEIRRSYHQVLGQPEKSTICEGDALPWAGRRLGHYRIVEELGRGGMGVVFKAHHLGLDRLVAIKTLNPIAIGTSEARHRFRTEARAIGRLQHPHIVQVFDYGDIEGIPYLCMELLEGPTLADLVSKGPIGDERSADVLLALAQAVHYAHTQNVLHRDLKPSNVLIDGQTPKLSDFGLAKLIDSSQDVTQSDRIAGTLSYIAPERVARGKHSPGVASDVYGLGAVLYEMLTGKPPFRGQTRTETMYDVLYRDPPRPSASRPKVDRKLEAICLRCLEKDPKDRYPSAQQLSDDLSRWKQGRPIAANGLRRLRLSRGSKLVVAVLLCVLSLTCSFAVWAHVTSHDYRGRVAASRVARGETVTLIGEKGFPPTHKILLGQARTKESTSFRDCFTIATWDTCLVELCPAGDFQEYVFSAQVAHIASDDAGEVGIFSGHLSSPVIPIERHSLIHLSYNDVQALGEFVEKLPSEFNMLSFVPNHVRILPQVMHRLGDGTVAARRGGGVQGPAFKAAGVGGGPWRTLTIKRSQEGIDATWDGQPLSNWSKEKSLHELTYLVDDDLKEALRQRFGRGGIGLYVHRGTAAFRNVTVSHVSAQ